MPRYERKFLILARSQKHGGQCVAGREITKHGPGRWIRPVSDRPGRELQPYEMKFQNGTPSIGDIVRVQFKQASPHPYQPENHIIHEGYYWELDRRASQAELSACEDGLRVPLWINGHGTRYGSNDKLPCSEAERLGRSLRCIEVSDLVITVEVEWPDFGAKRKVRGQFTYQGAYYALAITDKIYQDYYIRMPDGRYEVGAALLCISLGEPYKEEAYKLIAGVIVAPK